MLQVLQSCKTWFGPGSITLPLEQMNLMTPAHQMHILWQLRCYSYPRCPLCTALSFLVTFVFIQVTREDMDHTAQPFHLKLDFPLRVNHETVSMSVDQVCFNYKLLLYCYYCCTAGFAGVLCAAPWCALLHTWLCLLHGSRCRTHAFYLDFFFTIKIPFVKRSLFLLWGILIWWMSHTYHCILTHGVGTHWYGPVLGTFVQ